MQWLSKNTVIVALSVSLVSLLLIRSETKLSDNVVDKRTVVKGQVELVPLNPDKVQGVTNKVNQQSGWSDGKIVDRLNNKDPLILLQTLSHIWIHIDGYSKHDEIMGRVRLLAKHTNDNRISGLASLVSGELVQQGNLTKSATGPNDDWEGSEQEMLVWQDDQSESDYEKQDLSSFDNIKRDSVYSEDRIQYIDELLSSKDDSNINEFGTLILDADEEVSVAAVDALIMYLEQGIGDPEEIGALLEENMDFLDELQIQTVEELSDGSVNLKDY